MRRKTLLAIVLILVLAAGSRWLVIQNRPEEPVAASEIDMRFDYVMTGFEMRAYDTNGQLAAILEAPSLNQEAVSLRGDIEQPRLTLPGDGSGGVALKADNAAVSSDKNQISFTGSVLLQHESEPGGLTTVTTTSLVYDIEKGTAHSQDRVHVVRPGMQLTGTGLDADIRSSQYRLLSNVEGSYEK